MLAITADICEQESRVPRHLQSLGAAVRLERLEAGDYVVSDGCLVERKHVVDLHHSLIQGRLWQQLRRLRKASRVRYLLVEGVDLSGPVPADAIRGALLAASELGIGILRSVDAQDSAAWLYRLAYRRQLGAPVRVVPAYAQRPKAPPDETAEAMLAAVPGISRVLARRLLDRFGTVASVASAPSHEWLLVEGMGARRVAALERALLAERVTSHSAEQNGNHAT